MWGGQTYISADEMLALNEAFYWFNINHPEDPYGAVILAYVYVPAEGYFISSLDLEYGKPVADAPIFENFTSIPYVETTLRITNLTALTIELNATQPSGSRETFWAFMVQNDVQLMTDIQGLYATHVMSIANASGLLPALVFQPISEAMTSQMAKNGGNALGLTTAEGPLTRKTPLPLSFYLHLPCHIHSCSLTPSHAQ